MSPGSTCACLLCHVESHLLSELTLSGDREGGSLLASSERLRQFPSVALLLEELKSSQADSRSDELFRALFAAHDLNRQSAARLLILAFLPMLHRTVRRVAKHQRVLSPDDIAQQALSTLLEHIRSEQLRSRTSHFAFAISRAVKRRMFEWANREGSIHGVSLEVNVELLGSTAEKSFEQHALLRHFLYRCVRKSLLNEVELDLLIQFKLDGNNLDFPACASDRNSSNARRQKLKRLLAKLRRLARNPDAAHDFQISKGKNILHAGKRKPRSCADELPHPATTLLPEANSFRIRTETRPTHE
jgi:hypothetical protein